MRKIPSVPVLTPSLADIGGAAGVLLLPAGATDWPLPR
jgi:hypothetical protein